MLHGFFFLKKKNNHKLLSCAIDNAEIELDFTLFTFLNIIKKKTVDDKFLHCLMTGRGENYNQVI